MIIILTSPQKEDWIQIIEYFLRRCPIAEIIGNQITFGEKIVGKFHFTDQEFFIEGNWERGLKCVAMVIGGATMVAMGGSITIDGHPTKLEDLDTEVGSLISEENYRLEHRGNVIEKEIRLAGRGGDRISHEEFQNMAIPNSSWDESLGQIILKEIDEAKAMILAKKYHLNWWIKMDIKNG